jgi:4-hydroxy-3-polyprenylbenzoate decarboxylase
MAGHPRPSDLLPLVVAITGASGAVYAVRLLEQLLAQGREVHLMISPAGAAVIRQELGRDVTRQPLDVSALLLPARQADGTVPPATELAGYGPREVPSAGRLHYHAYGNLMAPPASGSFLTGGMVICPCSGSTLSAVAHAASQNLIQRAAEVHLKERRPLILVPRETPLSLPQLENMRKAARAGAVVLPATPGWYHGVRSWHDLVDFVVARILDQLGIPHDLMRRWGEASDGTFSAGCKTP